MSYCRWSSDDFQCDVYVYEDVAGCWTTHIASRRRHIPDDVLASFPVVDENDFMSWHVRHRAVMDWLSETKDHAQLITLDHMPSSGETFHDDTPGECADRLEALRAEGFNVPQYAIDSLREEQIEFDANGGREAYENAHKQFLIELDTHNNTL
jgi:hypothetical protein